MFIKQRARINIGVIVAAAIALTALFSSQSFAANTANVLKVSPLRTDVQIAAGSSKTVPITVTNTTNGAITVSPIENDFTSSDEIGTPAIILDAKTYAPTHSLKRFMTPLSDVLIPAGKSKTIEVLITVPKTAQAGGYFGAIRLAPSSPDSGGQVNLSANIASLILLTVPGATVEKLNLTDFNVQQNGKENTYFNTPSNLQVHLRFENKGNVQDGPFGKIFVKQGSKVVYETDFNTTEPRDVILPDGARRWDVPLKSIGTFGYFTATATLTYGLNNTTVEVSKSFWVIPTYIIIAAGVALVVLIALIVVIVFAIRRKRRQTHRYR